MPAGPGRVGAWLCAVVLLATSGTATASPAPPSPALTTLLFQLGDARIDEASGIAVGIASPGAVYVQNDSGDSARFFALDARTGRTLATFEVPGARNVDWEDIAVAPDDRGVPSLWIGDIGDNDSVRKEVTIYRVDEPHVDMTAGFRAATTGAPQVWRLRYPDGPADAESLAVAPGGAAYIFTKSLRGATKVYAVPPRPDSARVQSTSRIGSIQFSLTGTPGGPNSVGEWTATGAALSRDGGLLAVRTYTDAYVWKVPGGDVAAALHAEPLHLALPEQPQGEGVTVDGSRLLIDSEHAGSAVYAVPLPTTPTGSASPVSRSPAPSKPAALARPGGARSVSASEVALLVVAAVVLLAAALVVAVRRRSGGRST